MKVQKLTKMQKNTAYNSSKFFLLVSLADILLYSFTFKIVPPPLFLL